VGTEEEENQEVKVLVAPVVEVVLDKDGIVMEITVDASVLPQTKERMLTLMLAVTILSTRILKGT
jgi:hypothetical protein